MFLHDGPVQSLAGIALMLDAVLHAVDDGRLEDAKRVLTSALERHRQTIRSLRDLSFNLEPVVLRDQGLGPAVEALADQLRLEHRVAIELSVEGVERVAERAQVALYQIVREALNQAVRRGPTTISVEIGRREDESVLATIRDDGADERRRGAVEVLEERARTLGGSVKAQRGAEGGSAVRIELPAHAVRR